MEVLGRILGREVLPSTQEVWREESRRNFMLGKETRDTPKMESSALAAKSN